MIKPSSIVRVPTSIDDFFRHWLVFLKPFHELTDRQIDLAAAYLKIRYELSKVITDDNLLNENVMSGRTAKRLMEECGFSLPHFKVMMGALKKHKFIVNDAINPRYIPNISSDSQDSFSLMIYFPFENDSIGK